MLVLHSFFALTTLVKLFRWIDNSLFYSPTKNIKPIFFLKKKLSSLWYFLRIFTHTYISKASELFHHVCVLADLKYCSLRHFKVIYDIYCCMKIKMQLTLHSNVKITYYDYCTMPNSFLSTNAQLFSFFHYSSSCCVATQYMVYISPCPSFPYVHSSFHLHPVHGSQ